MYLDHELFPRFHAMLASPDPKDLLTTQGTPRGHRITVHGDPERRTTVFIPLLIRWAQQRYSRMDEVLSQ